MHHVYSSNHCIGADFGQESMREARNQSQSSLFDTPKSTDIEFWGKYSLQHIPASFLEMNATPRRLEVEHLGQMQNVQNSLFPVAK
jgi:hypothetical protein